MINKEVPKPLSKEDKEFMETMRAYGEYMDETYGKPIIGQWLPFGPKRNPKTEEQKRNWKNLIESHRQ